MKTILIDNNDSFTYNIVGLLQRWKPTSYTVVDSNEVEMEELVEYEKIIISPGHGTPKDFPSIHRILDRYKESHSILGICLGHQAICEYFGATLYPLSSVCHGQQQAVNIVGPKDYLFEGLPSDIQVGLYHSWAVDMSSLPNELQTTSISENEVLMSVRHMEYDVCGIQFHLESFLTTEGTNILENFLSH